MRGATGDLCLYCALYNISTHAPLAGRDPLDIKRYITGFISTHAPLAGRDGAVSGHAELWPKISTHAPLAGRDVQSAMAYLEAEISTHAPLAGRDLLPQPLRPQPKRFQPTRPLRGATGGIDNMKRQLQISTHAPLAGRDGVQSAMVYMEVEDFNPRAPCGARLSFNQLPLQLEEFQPTRPLRGATRKSMSCATNNTISTHAPLAGRDSKSVQITMHIFAITDKFQMFLRKMPTVRAFCFFFVREKRANFSANRPDNFCALVLRTIRSSVPRADTSACSRSVRFYSRTSCPSSKIEGCPFLGQ